MVFRRSRSAGAAALVTALLMALVSCAHPQLGPGPGHPATTPQAVTAAAAKRAAVARVAAVVAAMSLPEKVGQLLVPVVPGTAGADGGAALVRDYHVGGVIYFANNIQTASQVARLSRQLQQAATGQRPGVPLLIGTDQEGGIVSRLGRVGTLFPGEMASGATRDPAEIFAQERVAGTELRALGINLDYAPVADVNVDPANPVIGIRSFGSKPGLVSAMTKAAVAGFHAAGEAATAKHFPGHGDTDVDSHTGLPIIHHTLAQWWRIDAPPFEAAIGAGVDEIMIAHIVVPALDGSRVPASLSRKIVTGILRDKLGYHGVITSDSLQMEAVLNGRSGAQAAVDAIKAGCDQVLMPDNLPVAYHALLAAARTGQIPAAQLDASLTRIISLKFARGLLPHLAADLADPQLNTPQEAAVAQQLADRSVTLVRNRGAASGTARVLPIRAGQSVYLAGPAAPGLAAPLRAELGARGGRLVTAARSADVIVVATLDAIGDPAQRRLVAGLAATRKPVVVVAMGEPYDLGLFPGSAAEIATYSYSGASIIATAAVLAGRLSPSGRLPVSIPAASGGTAYPYGTGFSY